MIRDQTVRSPFSALWRTRQPMNHRSLFSCCLLAALCLVASTASLQANAQKVKEGSFGKGKAGGPLLTRNQLRECMSQQQRISVQSDETLALQSQFDRDKAEIQRQGVALKEELAALDRTNAELVDQYNAKAAARDKMIDEFEARAAAYNLRVQQLQTDRAAYASACENRRFDEKDEIAVKNGK